MALFEALHGRRCKTPIFWEEVGKKQLLGPEWVQTTNAAVQKIKQRILSEQSRQKSYADSCRKDLEFAVGDHVFLKVFPMRGVLRFGKKGKMSPRFVGPFEVLERIGPVAYRLSLPPTLVGVHNVFHVSMLRKYTSDPTHIIDHETLPIRKDLSYEEKPIGITARDVRRLRRREILLVKGLWENHQDNEAT